MVRPITLAAACALIAIPGAEAQTDLTPTESFYEIEGTRTANVTFTDGNKKIPYTPPAGWTLSGGGKKLSLAPRDVVQAGGTIETETARAPLPPATEDNIKAYADVARSLVPRDASKVEVVEAIISPTRISGNSMVDVTLSYSFFGQQFRMNVLFMPRDTEQLRFRFVARAADFPPLSRSFRSS
ncbi:MAG: hypothetical protein ABIZ56_01960, partial [Chthoniobacteraceae bacterium]